MPGIDFAGVGWAKALAFRADGSTLTFVVQDDNGRWQLHDLSFSTGLESILFLDPTSHDLAPAWSPNGRISSVSNGPLSHDIYVDAQPVQSYANHSRAAWLSADSFVASIADKSSAGSLYLIDLTKQWMTAIGSTWAGSPAVDPGRHRIAYAHPDADGWSLWVANIDGTNPTRITRGFSDLDAAWSADGDSILFTRAGQGMFQYTLATGTLTQVTRRAVESMAWAP